MLTTDNGILKKSELAKKEQSLANKLETNRLDQYTNVIENYTTSRNSIATNHYIIDAGYDSSSDTWWRLYNDSWLEEGSFSSVTAGTTVLFPKEFNELKYTPYLTHNTNSTVTTMYKVLSVLNRTSTVMTISVSGGGMLFWSASGYAADSVMQNYN